MRCETRLATTNTEDDSRTVSVSVLVSTQWEGSRALLEPRANSAGVRRIPRHSGYTDSEAEGHPARSLAVGHPDVLHLMRVVQIPTALTIALTEEVDLAPFVRPYLFEVTG
jgi:hypothetical protein